MGHFQTAFHPSNMDFISQIIYFNLWKLLKHLKLFKTDNDISMTYKYMLLHSNLIQYFINIQLSS